MREAAEVSDVDVQYVVAGNSEKSLNGTPMRGTEEQSGCLECNTS